LIERLNPGPLDAIKISSDQPNEGKSVEFSCHTRSIERA